MTDPPFDIGLRLTVEVSRGPIQLADLKRPDWRNDLVPLIQREPGSRYFPPNVIPSGEDADRVLAETFANHPMVNVSGRPSGRRIDRADSPRGVQAIVVAEIVLRPELGPIPPGGEFPNVGNGELTEPYIVHATEWDHRRGSDDEHNAAHLLLQRVTGALPDELWRRDD